MDGRGSSGVNAQKYEVPGSIAMLSHAFTIIVAD
jgi:hypothetical protein